jgi:hypothetical protein
MVDNSGAAITFSDGTWSDPVSTDSGGELTNVSGPGSASCVAADDWGYRVTL